MFHSTFLSELKLETRHMDFQPMDVSHSPLHDQGVKQTNKQTKKKLDGKGSWDSKLDVNSVWKT